MKPIKWVKLTFMLMPITLGAVILWLVISIVGLIISIGFYLIIGYVVYLLVKYLLQHLTSNKESKTTIYLE